MIKVEGKRRVAFNTIISYSRSLIAVCLVLFSSRWALGYLGEVDYGLYNLIGSVLAVVVFLNTILANGDARFFAIGIGKNDQIELNRVFNTAFSLHLVIPLIVVIIGWFVGELVLKHYLVIPSDRIDSVIIAYRITMIASFVTMVTVPFSTLFIAYQNILDYSLILLFQTFLIFLSAYLIRYSFGGIDKLLLYAILMAISHVLVSVIMVIVSSKKYKCSNINFRFFFDKLLSIEIIKYSFWNMLGDLGHLVRTQGVAVIINLFFGPSGNAAYGIANQVSMQASNLTNSMSSSIAPEIYRLVGEKNIKAAKSLSGYASRVGVFLLVILGVPIIFNLDALLDVWLIDVPVGTNVLCVCFIFMYIVEKLTLGQLLYLKAVGRVAVVNIMIFFFYSMSVAFPFCGLKMLGLLGIGLSCLLSMLLSRCSVLYCYNCCDRHNMKSYLINTFLPTFALCLPVIVCASFSIQYHSISILHIIAVFASIFASTFIFSLYVLFSKEERTRVYSIVMSKLKIR